MSSKQREKCGGSSLRASTPRTPRGAAMRASPEAATPRGGTGAGSNLIVARGLYKVLEEVMHERPSAAQPKNSQSGGQRSRPNFLFCYLCGMQFGSASLRIHQPQCYVKKLIEWERMDPARRGPRPVDPETHEKEIKEKMALGGAAGGSGGGKLRGSELERFNEVQIQDFNANMLVKCDNCGRTFLPDRLEVHLRSCKPGAPSASKPVTRSFSGQTAGNKAPARPQSASPGVPSSANSRQSVPLDKEPSTPPAPSAARGQGARKILFAQKHQTAWGDAGGPASLEKDSPEPSPQCANLVLPPQEGTDDDVHDAEDGGGEDGCDGAAPASSPASGATRSVSRSQTKMTAANLAASEETAPGTTVGVDEEKQDIHKKVNDSPNPSAASLESMDVRICESLPVEEDALAGAGDDDGDDAPAAATATAAHVAAAPAAVPPLDDSQALDESNASGRHVVKIPLNNVSRFKNVASRVHAGLHKTEELPRCRFCNRTFNANRLSKHEEVCLERNKPNPRTSAPAGQCPAAHEAKKRNGCDTPRGARAGSGPKKQPLPEETPPAAPPAPGDVAAKRAPSPPQRRKGTEAENGSTDGTKQRFCFDCGAKLLAGKQRFCAECGTKLPP